MNVITAEIEKIRAVRDKISASFGHDPKKLVAFYAKAVSSKQPIDRGARNKKTGAKLADKH